jgi:hypothetical protein
MANKPDGMTLADLIAGQQKSNLKMNTSVEAQLKSILAQEKIAKLDEKLQVIQTAESIRSEKDESLSAEELKKGLLDKTGDGANANIVKMLAEIKKSNGFLKKQNDAKEVLGKVGDRREFKTIGQRIGGIKDNVKDFFTADGFLHKTGIVKRGSGGIASEALAARRDRKDYAKARMEAGDPTQNLFGKRKTAEIFERQRGEQQQLVRDTNKNDAKLQKYKDFNIAENQIAKSPEMKAKTGLAERWQKSDPSTRVKPDNSARADENNMSESEIEQAQVNEEQTDVLNKIEENTRNSAENLKPKEEGKEEKGGMLSGLGKGLSGIGGALGGAAKGLLALAASVWIISKAFKNFAEIEWETMAKGMLVIGALVVSTAFIKSSNAAATLLALGAALYITGAAIKNFAEIDWETMGKGILAIGALTAAVVAIGLFGPVVLAGAATLLAMGAALWMVSKAFENVAGSMDTFAAGLERIGAISGAGLMSTAAGILAVSAAMAAFGAGSAVAGLGNLVSGLLSIGQDSPIDKLEKMAKLGDGLQKAADGLERIGKAMQTIAQTDASIEVGKDSIKTKGKGINPAKVAPNTGNSVYKQSAQVAANDKTQPQQKQSTVISAPTQVNNSTQNATFKTPIRNQDNTVNSYLKSRYVA